MQLRPDFRAVVRVPDDMTEAEAKRLAAMVLTLAQPAKIATRLDGADGG